MSAPVYAGWSYSSGFRCTPAPLSAAASSRGMVTCHASSCTHIGATSRATARLSSSSMLLRPTSGLRLAPLGGYHSSRARSAAVVHAQRRRRLFGSTSSADDGDTEGSDSPGRRGSSTPGSGSSSPAPGLSDLPPGGLAAVPALQPLFEAERRRALLQDAKDIRQGADLSRISQELASSGLDLEADWAEVERVKQQITTTGWGATSTSTSSGSGSSPGGATAMPWGQQLMRPQRSAQQQRGFGGLDGGQGWLSPDLARKLKRQERRRAVKLQRPDYIPDADDDFDDDDYNDDYEPDEDSFGNPVPQAAAAEAARSTLPAMSLEQQREIARMEAQQRAASAKLQVLRAQQRERERRAAAAAPSGAAAAATSAKQGQQASAASQQQQQRLPQQKQQPPRLPPAQAASSASSLLAGRPPGSKPGDFEDFLATYKAQKQAQKEAAARAEREAAARQLLERQQAAFAARKAAAAGGPAPAPLSRPSLVDSRAGSNAAADKAAAAFEKLLASPKMQAAIQRLSGKTQQVRAPSSLPPELRQQQAALGERPLTPTARAQQEQQQLLEQQRQEQEWEEQLAYVAWAAQEGKAAEAQERVLQAAAKPLPVLSKEEEAAAERARAALQKLTQQKAVRPAARPGAAPVPPPAAAPTAKQAAGGKPSPQQPKQAAAVGSSTAAAAPVPPSAEAQDYADWAAVAGTDAAEAAAAKFMAASKFTPEQEARAKTLSASLSGLKRPPAAQGSAAGRGAAAGGPSVETQQPAGKQTQRQQQEEAAVDKPSGVPTEPADADGYAAWAAEAAAEANAAAAKDAEARLAQAVAKLGPDKQARLSASAAAFRAPKKPTAAPASTSPPRAQQPQQPSQQEQKRQQVQDKPKQQKPAQLAQKQQQGRAGQEARESGRSASPQAERRQTRERKQRPPPPQQQQQRDTEPKGAEQQPTAAPVEVADQPLQPEQPAQDVAPSTLQSFSLSPEAAAAMERIRLQQQQKQAINRPARPTAPQPSPPAAAAKQTTGKDNRLQKEQQQQQPQRQRQGEGAAPKQRAAAAPAAAPPPQMPPPDAGAAAAPFALASELEQQLQRAGLDLGSLERAMRPTAAKPPKPAAAQSAAAPRNYKQSSEEQRSKPRRTAPSSSSSRSADRDSSSSSRSRSTDRDSSSSSSSNWTTDRDSRRSRDEWTPTSAFKYEAPPGAAAAAAAAANEGAPAAAAAAAAAATEGVPSWHQPVAPRWQQSDDARSWIDLLSAAAAEAEASTSTSTSTSTSSGSAKSEQQSQPEAEASSSSSSSVSASEEAAAAGELARAAITALHDTKAHEAAAADTTSCSSSGAMPLPVAQALYVAAGVAALKSARGQQSASHRRLRATCQRLQQLLEQQYDKQQLLPTRDSRDVYVTVQLMQRLGLDYVVAGAQRVGCSVRAKGAAGKEPLLLEWQLVEGHVARVLPFAAFVRLTSGQEVMLGKASSSSMFIDDMEQVVQVGQPVRGLLRLNPNKGRFELNTRLLERESGRVVFWAENVYRHAAVQGARARHRLFASRRAMPRHQLLDAVTATVTRVTYMGLWARVSGQRAFLPRSAISQDYTAAEQLLRRQSANTASGDEGGEEDEDEEEEERVGASRALRNPQPFRVGEQLQALVLGGMGSTGYRGCLVLNTALLEKKKGSMLTAWRASIIDSAAAAEAARTLKARWVDLAGVSEQQQRLQQLIWHNTSVHDAVQQRASGSGPEQQQQQQQGAHDDHDYWEAPIVRITTDDLLRVRVCYDQGRRPNGMPRNHIKVEYELPPHLAGPEQQLQYALLPWDQLPHTMQQALAINPQRPQSPAWSKRFFGAYLQKLLRHPGQELLVQVLGDTVEGEKQTAQGAAPAVPAPPASEAVWYHKRAASAAANTADTTTTTSSSDSSDDSSTPAQQRFWPRVSLQLAAAAAAPGMSGAIVRDPQLLYGLIEAAAAAGILHTSLDATFSDSGFAEMLGLPDEEVPLDQVLAPPSSAGSSGSSGSISSGSSGSRSVNADTGAAEPPLPQLWLINEAGTTVTGDPYNVLQVKQTLGRRKWQKVRPWAARSENVVVAALGVLPNRSQRQHQQQRGWDRVDAADQGVDPAAAAAAAAAAGELDAVLWRGYSLKREHLPAGLPEELLPLATLPVVDDDSQPYGDDRQLADHSYKKRIAASEKFDSSSGAISISSRRSVLSMPALVQLAHYLVRDGPGQRLVHVKPQQLLAPGDGPAGDTAGAGRAAGTQQRTAEDEEEEEGQDVPHTRSSSSSRSEWLPGVEAWCRGMCGHPNLSAALVLPPQATDSQPSQQQQQQPVSCAVGAAKLFHQMSVSPAVATAVAASEWDGDDSVGQWVRFECSGRQQWVLLLRPHPSREYPYAGDWCMLQDLLLAVVNRHAVVSVFDRATQQLQQNAPELQGDSEEQQLVVVMEASKLLHTAYCCRPPRPQQPPRKRGESRKKARR